VKLTSLFIKLIFIFFSITAEHQSLLKMYEIKQSKLTFGSPCSM